MKAFASRHARLAATRRLGCTWAVPRDSTVVTVSAYGPNLFDQHEHGVWARLDVRDSSVGATKLSYPPIDVRDCNQSKTACSMGIGVIDGTAEIISASSTSATVAINLNCQVGRSYSLNANGQQFKQEGSPDVQVLQAHQVIAKKIEVAYGEVVHLPLPFGVDVALCAQKYLAGEMMPERSVCQWY